MFNLRLKDWLANQPPPQFVDESNVPVHGAGVEFLDQWRAEDVLRLVQRDIDAKAALSIKPGFRPVNGEGRRYWQVEYNAAGQNYTVAAGDLFSEICSPYGWAEDDYYTYDLGVPEYGLPNVTLSVVRVQEAGSLQNGRTLFIQAHPERRLVITNERPNPGITSGAEIQGTASAFAGDDQAAMVKETLRLTRAIAGKLGAL